VKLASRHALMPPGPRARTRQWTVPLGSWTCGVARRFVVVIRHRLVAKLDDEETSTS
jgi:hypothetical protein